MPQFGGKPVKKTKKTSSDSKRHFTVVMGGKEHGLYVSSTPSSAAKKAVTKLCAANKSKKVEFYMRETTQGSKKKTYGPYEGYIEKLKEPIELKGRVIKYKPVAKLSGKTFAKKGGMRGGAKSIVISVDNKPRFRIITDADFKKEYLFNPQHLLRNTSSEKFLFDYTKAFPFPSPDGKSISFGFQKDISDGKIEAFLNDQEKKSEILRKLKELRIPYEVKIFLDIPYMFDGEFEPRYEEREYLVYNPSANLDLISSLLANSGKLSLSKLKGAFKAMDFYEEPNLDSIFAASAKIFSNSEKQSLSNLKGALKALSLGDEKQYINSVKRGLIAEGFTGKKYDEAYRLLINSNNKTPSANLDSVFAASAKIFSNP
jgi:hypothetical protein